MQPRVYGPYEHRGRWRVHIVVSDRGTRQTRYKSYATWEQANAYINGARDEAQGHTVKDAVNALLAEMKANEDRDGSIATAEFRLHHFFQLPANDARPVRWLQHRGAELYRAAMVARSTDTHHAELALAKRVGDIAVKQRWLRSNPFAGIEPIGRKVHGSAKPRLRVDESRTLRTWCLEHGSEPRAIVTLAYLLLGARASELVKRDVRDLDDNGRLLWIDRTKTLAGRRRLQLPDELSELLLAMVKGRKPDAPLFAKEDGSRATRHWANYHVKAVCKAAGVPVLAPQALRRTQSDLATDAGIAAIEVARHLGHSSTTVTDRSYRDRQVTQDASGERAFKVIAGGKR
jgi:integrase